MNIKDFENVSKNLGLQAISMTEGILWSNGLRQGKHLHNENFSFKFSTSKFVRAYDLWTDRAENFINRQLNVLLIC